MIPIQNNERVRIGQEAQVICRKSLILASASRDSEKIRMAGLGGQVLNRGLPYHSCLLVHEAGMPDTSR